MDALRYWQLKIYQLLHDPPGKPFHLAPRGKGSRASFLKHAELAHELFFLFSGDAPPKGMTRPDRAASGADRPVVAAMWGKGRIVPLPYRGDGDDLIAHPLAPGARIHVKHAADTVAAEPMDVREDDDLQREVMGFLQLINFDGWSSAEATRAAALTLWRRTRDELMTRSIGDDAHRKGDALWEYMPADTRVPDHTIWDHTRIAAALAFLDTPMGAKNSVSPEQEPWLLQVSLSPVAELIGQSRKAQDLWLSSFLLADLAFHAMLPIIERYGPENIVSPDLRGNPRVDHWLSDARKDALPEFVRDPSTFAALLPNTFIAIVPRGVAGHPHLAPLQDVARQCSEAVETRWQQLSERVLAWFVRQAPQHGNALRAMWSEQHRSVVRARWTAVPWLLPERAAAVRADRLRAWVQREVWDHYEQARDVFERVDPNLLQGERGFDYALTHHQLRARHEIRKQTAHAPPRSEQPGEKCTLCGQRTALGDFGAAPGGAQAPIESRRQRVREFWKNERLDPERTGSERLCAVCAFKRFLVEADGEQEDAAINRTWAGRAALPKELKEGGKVRVPFPSTSAVAAQRFLANVAERPELEPRLREVVEAHDAAGLDQTQFPRALPRLAAAYRNGSPTAQKFLRLEPQETIFPRALDALIERARSEEPGRVDQLVQLQRAINKLLDAAGGEPATRFAVIKVDGDAMGRLLLGDPARIATRWRDVIHPKQVEWMEKNGAIQGAGWPALLDAKRLMGPSLHAFISRALADFTHRIVPWVVEREHAGRLIYAGGDDVLALAPAEDALPIAARLQEVFAAAWVIDTRYDVDTWAWRRAGADFVFDRVEAAKRFQIQPADNPELKAEGPLLAMLGPGASLSAGIVFGHFKMPLRAMLHHAGRLLDEEAKEKAGRSAAALSYYTRSGPKYQLAMRWKNDVEKALRLAVDAFRAGRLPSRLPYKLRECAAGVHGALDAGASHDDLVVLLRGLLRRELDGKALDESLMGAVLALWRAGLDASVGKDEGERMVDGLLLARALASGEPEDEE